MNTLTGYRRVNTAIPTRPSLLARMRRALLLRWLTWQADCIRDERQHYEAAGVVGPMYLRNSWAAQMRTMRLARDLEAGQ